MLTSGVAAARNGAGVLSRRGGVRCNGDVERACRGRGHESSSLSDELESGIIAGMPVLFASYRDGGRARGRQERRGGSGRVEEWVVDGEVDVEVECR